MTVHFSVSYPQFPCEVSNSSISERPPGLNFGVFLVGQIMGTSWLEVKAAYYLSLHTLHMHTSYKLPSNLNCLGKRINVPGKCKFMLTFQLVCQFYSCHTQCIRYVSQTLQYPIREIFDNSIVSQTSWYWWQNLRRRMNVNNNKQFHVCPDSPKTIKLQFESC